MNNKFINVLLVEDNQGDARLVQEMLAMANSHTSHTPFKCVVARRLEQALTRLSQEAFDLILLDLSLPDSHGLETLHRVLNTYPNVPVVVLSGLNDDETTLAAVQAGAQDFVIKGQINDNLLGRVIRYAIERHQVERRLHARNQELALLNNVIAASVTDSNSEFVLETTCRELALFFNVAQASVLLLNDEKTEATFVAEYRADGGSPALNQSIPVAGNPLAKQILIHKGPLAIEDAQKDPRLAPLRDLLKQYTTASLVILPLVVEGQVIGGLTMATTEVRHFAPQEIDLAWRVADQVAGMLARMQLDQERHLLSTAIEKTVESIIITDTQGRILYVNSGFERVTGYTKAEAIGQNPRLLKSGKHPRDFYKQLWDTISAGQVWQGHFINRRKDGILYTEEATVTPVFDNSGHIINYVAVKRDVTQEIEREEQYRQAQKMEAVGRLAGGIAHDFNNLLTVITGYTELLLASAGDADDGTRKDLEMVRSASQRAAVLTRQLLAFSRKQVLQPKVLNLNDIITDISKMLRRLIGEDIDLVTIPGQNLGRVKADPGHLEQVLVNLAVNARDAMPQGGQLTIETANIYLDEQFVSQHIDTEPGWYVMLAVSDTGVGMDADTRAKIFEPFFTTKGKDKGTGLGLATVYGIVKQSEGHIWVYSEPGQGTTFKVYLPQIELPADASTRRSVPQEAQQGTETILLVEDEADVRQLIHDALIQHGYTVLTACNGQDALQLCRQHQHSIHLLLTDVVMPGEMGGAQLADQVTAMYPNIKTLFVSGYPDSSIMHQGVLKKGAVFLQKPLSPHTLARKVREVLDS